jgi:hypothetical protein
MGDPNNEYPTVKPAYIADDPVVSYLQAQGYNVGHFVYYQGFRGPLEIWNVSYPGTTRIYPQFFDPNFTYGGLDYLFNWTGVNESLA